MAILEPENDVVGCSYAEIRENLRIEGDGQALRLLRYSKRAGDRVTSWRSP
jgi:hypothetical protein